MQGSQAVANVTLLRPPPSCLECALTPLVLACAPDAALTVLMKVPLNPLYSGVFIASHITAACLAAGWALVTFGKGDFFKSESAQAAGCAGQ